MYLLAVHDLCYPVDEDQHVVGRFLVDVLEVVDVAEPEDRVDAHT